MDQVLIAESAGKLEKILLQYSSVDVEIASLLRALSSLIALARAGKIVTPIDSRDVPGNYPFVEGNLRKYNDLETAYARFRIEISGGEPLVLRNLRLYGIKKP
jgi:hypothetical protein